MKSILFLTMFLFSQICVGQNLKEIFLSIPDSHLELNKSQRDSLIQNFIDGKNNSDYGISSSKYLLKEYEPRNGYLKYINQKDESTTLTYWNVDSNNKLIGIAKLKLGNPSSSSIHFIQYSNSFFKEIDNDQILPKLSHKDFFDLSEMSEEQIKTEIPMFNNLDLIFKLPSSGKNIIVHSQYSEFNVDDRILKYTKGWDLELLWNNGKFIKGNFVE